MTEREQEFPLDEKALADAIFGTKRPRRRVTPPQSEEEVHSILEEQVDRVLAGLTPRERVVLELRFGLEDGRAMTLREAGRDPRINRSSSTVWRIEHQALLKLRPPGPRKTLKDYLIES